MSKYFSSSFFQLSLLFLVSHSLSAQSPIQWNSDQDWHHVPYFPPSLLSARASAPDTLSIAGGNAFFDDFTYTGPLPDSTRWFLSGSDIEAPYVNAHRAINPPTWGVASFDGTNRFNEPYNTASLSNGLCDRLTTHYIDLAPFQAADDLKLSFALQAQGKGEAPEVTDSFFVYFYLPELNQQDQVFAAAGSANGAFKQVIIPINKPEYFRTQFQVIFESHGSQNGKLDEWHLDYVYLNAGRTGQDTFFHDIAPTEVLHPPLSPYTAIPMAHFDPGSNFMRPYRIGFNNLSLLNKAPIVQAEITDPKGSNPFVGLYAQDQVLQLPSLSRRDLLYNAFSNQYFLQAGEISLSVAVPSSNDLVNSNNILRETYRIDSVFAYDDGEADRSIGLNKAWGLANRFIIQQPDTLKAIWISFVPTMNFNPVTTATTYMENQVFRLTIWKDAHPDSIAAQQIAGAKVKYGDQPDHFERFALTEPIAVSDTFWVGIVQASATPLGIGFDTQYEGKGLVWRDSSGVWTPIREKGVLMVRPELQSRTNFGPAAVEQVMAGKPFQILPNPVRDFQLSIHYQGPVLSLYQGRLFSVDGVTIATYERVLLPGENRFELPTLPPGLYFWQHYDGQAVYSEKIILQDR